MTKKKKRLRPKHQPIPEDQCTIRVVQVKRSPSSSPAGIRRRPRIIQERVTRWYHRCAWCNEWFRPDRANQRYCDYRCRHSQFRERARTELSDLRKKARR